MGPRMNMGMSMLGANPMMNMSMPANLNVPFPTGDYNNMGQPSPNAMSMNMNMNMNMGMMGMGMGMGMDPSAMNPMMIAAHQQAMMIAKQTYQLAVAQQAMQDAADEWERGSSVSGWGGGGGGGGRASVAPSSVNVPTGGMPMMNGMFPGAMGMGMGMGMGGLSPGGMNMGMGWQGGAGMMFPQGPRSMYTGSVYAASDAGGSVAGGGWGSRSVYGENFGPSGGDRPPRSSRPNHGSPAPASVAGGGGGIGGSGSRKDGPRTRTRTAPSSGPGQAPGKRGGQALLGAVSPPSSWRGPS